MTQITPLSSFSNTEETSISSTRADTAVSIAGSSLLNNVKYLVIYTCGFGASDITSEPEPQVEFGSTIIAHVGSECSSSGGVNHGRGKNLCGFHIITGNGSDGLKITKRRSHGSGTTYYGGLGLIAIPLDDLTEDDDYFQTTQNGDAAELSLNNNPTATGDLLSLTKTLEATDYLILASCEVQPTSDDANNDTKTNIDIDGTDQKEDQYNISNASMANHFLSFSYARIHTFTAASHTIKIEAEALGSDTKNRAWRRGRIILIKKDIFDQMVSTTDDTSDTVGVNYSTFEDDNSHTYTPNQQEHVVVLGNAMQSTKQNFRSTYFFLLNNDDSTEFSKYIGCDYLGQNTSEVQSILVAGTEQISAEKTYKIRRSDENNTTHNQVNYSDIIVWSMELAEAGGTTLSTAKPTVSAIIG